MFELLLLIQKMTCLLSSKHKSQVVATIHHSSYLQVFSQAITILARQVLPSGIEPVPAFSLLYVRRQETFVNLCHIKVPKG